MKTLMKESVLNTHSVPAFDGIKFGKIAGKNSCGQILVDYPGNQAGPVEARLSSSVVEALRQKDPVGREIMIAFENQDPKRPVIIDILHSLIDEISEQPIAALELGKPEDVTTDGKRISFNAKEEIVLKCGKASITLTKAGKVLIRGAYLSSHSSGANRIKGGSVDIN